VRTLDGGVTWQPGRVPGADTLEFRDVHAVNADTAYLLSAGKGELSRIYKTADGGRSWTLQFTNRDSAAFFDCFDFWDAAHGLAYSDAVAGRTVVIGTTDGGAHWDAVPPERLPSALANEGAFAASGTCVTTQPGGYAWIATGNGPMSRVLRTMDYGRSWTAARTPILAGPGAGVMSVAFRDQMHGVALGGNIGLPQATTDAVTRTEDGGLTWVLAGRPRLRGPVYGGVYVPGARVPTLVAVGPGGADMSTDDGRSWTSVDTVSYWSVGFASPRAGWAVGPKGRITKLELR
jgi:photosystem II stability/assembly factor-like uncharacterized protein